MTPSTTGEVSKWKINCVPPIKTVTEFAGVPFTMKTLPSTPPSGAVRLTVKSVGGVPTTMLPHGGELFATEQPAGDGVGVGGTVAVGVTVAVRVGVAVGVGVDVGVNMAVDVGVGDAVGVGVGDGVGPLCTSNDPTSIRLLRTRQKTGPRWS